MTIKANFLTVILMTVTVTLWSQGTGGGSLFYEKVRTLSIDERESAIVEEFKKGNYPSFMDTFCKITTKQKDVNGKTHRVTIFVSPNYLSIGNNEDFFIVPMSPKSAQQIAEMFNCSLPTPKVADIVYEHSQLKLEPFNFFPRGNRNETPDILYDHSKIIQAQIKAAGFPVTTLVSGIKKDIVISSKLADPKRDHHVTIYGWHKLDGKPIQPLSNIHIEIYVDYSHGARLVSEKVIIDGKEHRYSDLLKDPLLYTLLSNEPNPLTKVSYMK